MYTLLNESTYSTLWIQRSHKEKVKFKVIFVQVTSVFSDCFFRLFFFQVSDFLLTVPQHSRRWMICLHRSIWCYITEAVAVATPRSPAPSPLPATSLLLRDVLRPHDSAGWFNAPWYLNETARVLSAVGEMLFLRDVLRSPGGETSPHWWLTPELFDKQIKTFTTFLLPAFKRSVIYGCPSERGPHESEMDRGSWWTHTHKHTHTESLFISEHEQFSHEDSFVSGGWLGGGVEGLFRL